ncbi:MAG: hypothetical protein WCO02_07100 [Bacteroidota bacterium]
MKTRFKVLSVLLLAGVLLACLVFYFMYNKPHPDYEKMEAAYTLPANELFSAYTANKAEAGKKYNGQVIVVKGAVSKVESSDSLAVVVFVFRQGIFGDEGLRCTMSPSHIAKAKALQPGKEVILKGFCSGFNDTDVVLEKCSFAKQ